MTERLVIIANASLMALFVWLGGCGGGDPGVRRGYTTCSGDECQPGQYCKSHGGQFCADGCLSDENCAANQTCKKAAGADVGTCVNTDGNPSGDPVARCQQACDAAATCGLFNPQDVVGCKGECPALPATAANAVADCVDRASCGPTLGACFGR